MRRVGHSLGAGVASLVDVFNPSLIVFGGSVRHISTVTEPSLLDDPLGVLAGTSADLQVHP